MDAREALPCRALAEAAKGVGGAFLPVKPGPRDAIVLLRAGLVPARPPPWSPGAVAGIEALQMAQPGSFNEGEQFNLWIAR